jgi:uncharacterized Zn-binding protein involved in type VI secretion
MPQSVTITAMTAGVDGPPTMILQGSPNVVFQGLAASYITCSAVPHKAWGAKHPHGRNIASGSPNVLINGMDAAFVGCAMSCGDVVGTSNSPTVLIN